MTFLATEITRFGTALVAESAVLSIEEAPFSKQVVRHTVFGGVKVFPFPRLKCGVGIWGAGTLETKDGKSSTPDVWIRDFLEQQTGLERLADYCEALKDHLVANLKDPQYPFGIQLAGAPAGSPGEFFEITNVNPKELKEGGIMLFNYTALDSAWGHRPAEGVIRLGRGVRYGTGFLNNMEEVVGRMVQLTPQLDSFKKSLQGRVEFLSCCIRSACDLERGSGIRPLSIGGDVSFVTISPDGTMTYRPPYEESKIA